MVEPSSALRSCTAENLTSVRPHSEHVICTVASVTSALLTVCTVDRFDRRVEGNADALDRVVIVCDDASLHRAPQTSHVSIAWSSPVDASSRLPQSLQNTSDPMADMPLSTPACGHRLCWDLSLGPTMRVAVQSRRRGRVFLIVYVSWADDEAKKTIDVTR